MINKHWAFALSILSLTTAISFADQTYGGTIPAQAKPMGVTSQPSGVITPPVAPVVNNGADFFVETDFIYWQVQESGLEYARTAYVNTSSSESVEMGTVNQVNRQWEPGFKLGMGLELEHDGWDVFVNWTWLNPVTDNKSSTSADSAEDKYVFLPPFGNNLFSSNLCDEAQATWTLHYNTLDLELGRNFFVSRYMTLRPYFGLKSAWINQYANATYDMIDDEIITNPYGPYGQQTFNNVPYTKYNQSLESWGLGVRGGLSPVWHFSRCWGMYGNVALTALYQYNSAEAELHLYQVENPSPLGMYDYTIVKYKRSNHTVTPVLELALGVQYTKWFNDEAYMLDIKAGWEEQVWFNANQFIDAGNGNLTFQGFTFNVGFHF